MHLLSFIFHNIQHVSITIIFSYQSISIVQCIIGFYLFYTHAIHNQRLDSIDFCTTLLINNTNLTMQANDRKQKI